MIPEEFLVKYIFDSKKHEFTFRTTDEAQRFVRNETGDNHSAIRIYQLIAIY